MDSRAHDAMRMTEQVVKRYGVTHPDLHQKLKDYVEEFGGGLANLRNVNQYVIDIVTEGIPEDPEKGYFSMLERIQAIEDLNGGCTEEGKAALRACITFFAMHVRFPNGHPLISDDMIATLWKPMAMWLEWLANLGPEYKTHPELNG